MRTITKLLEVKWDGVNWTDESAYFERADGDAIAVGGANSALIGKAQANSARITLNNSSKRFSAEYSGGALYSYIGGGKMRTIPVRLKVGVNGANVSIFTGAIDRWSEDTKAHTTTLICLDPSHTAIDKNASTPLYANVRTDVYINTLLTLAGISATVDPGFYCLPFAWMDDENIFQELRAVVDAEAGRIYYDEAGALHIENAAHWLHHTSSQHTFTVDNFGSCTLGYDWNAFANYIKIEFTPRVESCIQVIWTANEAYLIKPGETRTIECRMMNPISSVLDLVVGTDLIASSSCGMSMDSELGWSLVGTKAQTLTYELTNNNADHVLYVTHFAIHGTPVLGRLSRKVSAKNQDSIDQYGEIVRTAPVNVCVQTEAHAQSIVNMLCDRLSIPRLRYHLLEVPGVTGLTLGDRITLVEAHSGSSLDCLITRMTWSIISKFTMTFELIDADLFAVADYFKFGTSKYGNISQEGHGHMWY